MSSVLDYCICENSISLGMCYEVYGFQMFQKERLSVISSMPFDVLNIFTLRKISKIDVKMLFKLTNFYISKTFLEVLYSMITS